jgi:hypothetical protein
MHVIVAAMRMTETNMTASVAFLIIQAVLAEGLDANAAAHLT